MKDTAESSEFFCPDPTLTVQDYLAKGDRTAVHHIARYQWAAALLTQQQSGRILDVACGAGYGSHMLAVSNPALTIVGVDYDERAIEIARRRYAAPNLRFLVGDIVRWCDSNGNSLGSFEAVVSFDTIEHLLHREIALVNIAENVNASGSLVLSTPCGHQKPVLNPGWEHHKIEYSGPYLYNVLARYFREVLYPDNRSLPQMEFWDELNRSQSIYWNRMNPLVCRKPIQFGMRW